VGSCSLPPRPSSCPQKALSSKALGLEMEAVETQALECGGRKTEECPLLLCPPGSSPNIKNIFCPFLNPWLVFQHYSASLAWSPFLPGLKILGWGLREAGRSWFGQLGQAGLYLPGPLTVSLSHSGICGLQCKSETPVSPSSTPYLARASRGWKG
jgi:hypothetical protein